MQNELVHATIKHIYTYSLTVPKAVSRLFDLEDAVATEILERLVEAGLVAKSPLFPGQDFYHLRAEAAEYLDVETIDDRPKIGTAKCVAYGTLQFCCMQDHYRPLIPQLEYRTRFPNLYRPGPKINYYTDNGNLGYIRVETASSTAGDVFRVVERCWRDVVRRTAWKGGGSKQFQSLVETGRFRVTLLTPFEGKADRIRKILFKMDERRRLYDIRAKDVKEFGSDHFTHNEPAFIEYQNWHRNEPKGRPRKPPRNAPPMDVHVVPGLLDIMYSKPTPNAAGNTPHAV